MFSFLVCHLSVPFLMTHGMGGSIQCLYILFSDDLFGMLTTIAVNVSAASVKHFAFTHVF